jgi:plastocyanin
VRRSLMSDNPFWVAPLVLAVGGATLLAGCGSSSKGGSTAAPASTPAATSAAPATSSAAPASSAAAATEVTATETEFKIALSQSTFTAGAYTFKAVNSGKFPHALTIVGPGVASVKTAILTPGKSASVTVTFQAGSYEIYCQVDHHKALGMDLHITVT